MVGYALLCITLHTSSYVLITIEAEKVTEVWPYNAFMAVQYCVQNPDVDFKEREKLQLTNVIKNLHVSFEQCCGSGSTGSTCFWAIRIH
jgi:hypothetical protein